MQYQPFFWALCLVLLFSACDRNSEADIAGTVTVTPTPTPVVTPDVLATPDFTSPVTPTQISSVLTIWAPPHIVARTEAGTIILSEQRFTFRTSHNDVEEVRLEQKSVSGQGSILNYLRTGRNVAPAILPDLVALPTDQLATAAAEGLIYPLDDFLEANALDGLYPAAQALAQVDGQIYAYPFVLDNLSHIIYNSNVLTDTLPTTWEAVAQMDDVRFTFPAAGQAGAMLSLQFYLASGGRLTNEAGQPTIEVGSLTTALTLLNEGVSSGFILPQSSNVASSEDAWQLLQTGAVDMALVTADQYLQERIINPGFSFASVAGPNGLVTPLVEGWAWAVSTSDPTRRAIAVELLQMLVQDSNLGEWSYQSRLLPASQEALAQWPTDDTYVQFVQQELERAQPAPVSGDSSIIQSLREAVLEVVSGIQAPAFAAEEAAKGLQP